LIFSRATRGMARMNIPFDAVSDPFQGVKFKSTSEQFHIVKTWSYASCLALPPVHAELSGCRGSFG
jgi:hypothetical protein